jgi:hypothetical protein
VLLGLLLLLLLLINLPGRWRRLLRLWMWHQHILLLLMRLLWLLWLLWLPLQQLLVPLLGILHHQVRMLLGMPLDHLSFLSYVLLSQLHILLLTCSQLLGNPWLLLLLCLLPQAADLLLQSCLPHPVALPQPCQSHLGCSVELLQQRGLPGMRTLCCCTIVHHTRSCCWLLPVGWWCWLLQSALLLLLWDLCWGLHHPWHRGSRWHERPVPYSCRWWRPLQLLRCSGLQHLLLELL